MNNTVKEGKTLAIVSYLTFVGLIIAIVMNLEKRNPFTTFHMRQMLGLIIMLIVSNMVEKYLHSFTGTALWALTFTSWIYCLFYCIKGEYRLLPIVGEKFQVWFRNIN